MFSKLEAEQKAIGVFIQHKDVFCAWADRTRPEMFSDPVFRATYSVLHDLYGNAENGHVEVNRVIEAVAEIIRKPCAAEIYKSVEEAVTAQSIDWAMGEVIAAYRKRYLHQSLESILGKLQRTDDTDPIFSELLTIATRGKDVQGQIYDGPTIATTILKKQEERREHNDALPGYCTGFPSVDGAIGGLVPKRLTILSGPSGDGKTGTVVNWLTNVSVVQQVPGLFASLEMDLTDVLDRMVGILTGYKIKQVQTGLMDKTVRSALEDIHQGKLCVSDNHPRDIHDLIFLVEKYVRTHGIKVFGLDYVSEIVRDKGPKDEGRDERFGRWIKAIRDLAKRHDFHAIVLCQVNVHGDLAESRKMGHLADHHFYFHREGPQHFLECRKNRFGPKYTYAIDYNRETQKMTEQGIVRKKDGGN